MRLIAGLTALAATAAAEPGVPFVKRSTVAQRLSERFGATVGSELLRSFDAGKFFPIFADNDGIDGQYVITWRKDCALPQWIEQDGHQHLARVRQTLIKRDPGAKALLTALRDSSGCVKHVTQNMVFRLPEMEMGLSAASQAVPAATSQASPVRVGQVDPGVPWGLDFLDGVFSEAYNPPYDGTGVRAYVLDTGVDDTHPLLPNVLPGFDATGGGSTRDPQGHGTHCAGTIAGLYVGVAPGASIVPVKVLGDDGTGSTTGIVNGMDWVVGEKEANPDVPMVASMSLGGLAIGDSAMSDAVEAMFDAGVTVVVAAGNSFISGNFFQPCNAPDALCIGALANPAFPDVGPTFQAAGYSNWGAKVPVWAPGSNVLSALSAQVNGVPTQPGPPGTQTWYASGTSMACPHVAGIVAQILQWNPSITPTEVHNTVMNDCAVDFGDGTLKSSPSRVVRTKNSASTDGPCAGGFAVSVSGSLPFYMNPSVAYPLSGLLLLGAVGMCIFATFVPKRGSSSVAKQLAEQAKGPKMVGGIDLSQYFIPDGFKVPYEYQLQAVAAGLLKMPGMQQQQPVQ